MQQCTKFIDQESSEQPSEQCQLLATAAGGGHRNTDARLPSSCATSCCVNLRFASFSTSLVVVPRCSCSTSSPSGTPTDTAHPAGDNQWRARTRGLHGCWARAGTRRQGMWVSVAAPATWAGAISHHTRSQWRHRVVTPPHTHTHTQLCAGCFALQCAGREKTQF